MPDIQPAIRAGFLACYALASLLSISPANAGDILKSQKKVYSFASEEIIARDYFNDKKNGFFVDIGSCYPTVINNTYYFEKNLGWRGIAVDAQDYSKEYARYRPKTKFFNYAVSDRSGERIPFYFLELDKDKKTSWSTMLADQAARVMREAKISKRPASKKKVWVPTITLNDLLESEGVTHIDYFSIDIELAEPMALSGFDIKKYRPDFVCIEAQRETRAFITKYFSDNGYVKIEEYSRMDRGLNWYFKPKDTVINEQGSL